VSTTNVTKETNRYSECYEKVLYAGLKMPRNILTPRPDPKRPDLQLCYEYDFTWLYTLQTGYSFLYSARIQLKSTTQFSWILPDYTKNAYNQRVSINVTHTTSTLPRQISTTKIPTMHSTMIGLDQGFSNYGSRPHLGSWNVILGPQKNWLTKSDYKFL